MTNKYLNKKTEIDGRVFDSRKEAKYYLYLKQRVADGAISDLRMQVPYELVPAVWEEQVVHLKTKDKVVKRQVQKPIMYVADFVYINNETGMTVVTDVKGFRTKEYYLKKKMMRALLGISITEV